MGPISSSGWHTWIGIALSTAGTNAFMEITPQFRDTLVAGLSPLRAGKGHVSTSQARRVVGQAQCLAQVVPEAQPWASAMWAALTAALQASSSHREEAQPGRLPALRFSTAA